jgi:hypothetical protein
MPWVGFEPIIPAFERAKTVRALDRAAIVIGFTSYSICIFSTSVYEIDVDIANNLQVVFLFWTQTQILTLQLLKRRLRDKYQNLKDRAYNNVLPFQGLA